MNLSQYNRNSKYLGPRLFLFFCITLVVLFAVGCEQSQSNSAEENCEEMELSPSQVCLQNDMTLAEDGDCELMSDQFCQLITYETTCSGELEVFCIINSFPCNEAAPEPSVICESEDLVLASQDECETGECVEVSYPSACGAMGRTLCREAEQNCENSYPNPSSLCEQEGLVIANDEDCESNECSIIEFEVGCGEVAEILCRPEMNSEPLPETCKDRSEEQCSQDTLCQWLIPEPWACVETDEILPAPGCFPLLACSDDNDCDEGERCRSVAFSECDDPESLCLACAEYLNLCLP